jgi:hypothetical protein
MKLNRASPLVVALFFGPFDAGAKPAVRQVEVAAARIKLVDLMANLGEAGELDLGPAPAPGASRLVTREEIAQALKEHQIVGVSHLPEAVRVARKMDQLTFERLRTLGEDAIARAGTRTGVRLKSLQPPASVRVASGWQSVTTQLPKSPRRAGEWTTTVMLSFEGEGQKLARVAVPAVFEISADGAAPDISKGAPLTLVIRTGLVEVSTKAVAGDNADIGETFAVTLRPSGKVVRAKLVAKGRAMVEGSTS